MVDDAVEPPVPLGLDQLTGSQAALVEFLRVDRDLVDAAAVGSVRRRRQPDYLDGWVASLADVDRNALLGLLRGDGPLLRAETLRRARPTPDGGSGVRTAGQLLGAAAARREDRERIERERQAARSA